MSKGTLQRKARGITDREWALYAAALRAEFGDENRSLDLRRHVRAMVAAYTGLAAPDDPSVPWPELDDWTPQRLPSVQLDAAAVVSTTAERWYVLDVQRGGARKAAPPEPSLGGALGLAVATLRGYLSQHPVPDNEHGPVDAVAQVRERLASVGEGVVLHPGTPHELRLVVHPIDMPVSSWSGVAPHVIGTEN